jgi:hypothetical protein
MTTKFSQLNNVGIGVTGDQMVTLRGGLDVLTNYTVPVPLAGGTMTGYLILNANPVTALGAATKQYVDAEIAGSGTVSSVGLSETDGLSLFTITNSPVTTSGTIGIALTGTIPPANGGTGLTSVTANAVVLGNGTSSFTTVSGLGTSGYVLTSQGAGMPPHWAASSGLVTSVSGTSGQIDVSATTGDVVVSIDSGYVGQASITTLGTIATGVWNGSVIPLAYGGTNHALTANNGGIAWSDASKLNILAGTATAGQLLLSGSTATPSWSTSTYPSTNAANTLLYASSANTMAALATANSGVLITSGAGVPSISTTIPATTQANITALGTIASGVWNGTAVTVGYGGTGNTTFTAYSVICAGTTSTGTFQNVSGLGTSGYILTSNGPGALPSWQANGGGGGGITTLDADSGSATGSTVTISGGSTGLTTSASSATMDLTGTLVLANGGTSASLTASNGGIFYSTASAGAILAGTATAHQLLLSGASTTPLWSTSTYPTTNAANTILYASSANVMAALATANSGVLITSGSGVPSISTTIPATTQANITAVGALASGSLASGFTAVTVPLGGTGNTTFTAYSVICAGTTSTGTFQNVSGVGTSGQVLTSNGASALPTWQAGGGGGGGSSTTTAVSQASHGFSVGNIVQSSGTADTYQLAKADTAADAEVAGIVSAVADANDFTLLTGGVVTGLSGLTTGDIYYLSASSAGAYTATPTTTAGQVNKPLFYAIDTTSAVWLNMRGEVIPSSGVSTVQGNNMILNGDFQVFQRTAMNFGGTATLAVPASTTEYCLDRWQILTNATQATTVTQEQITGWIFAARIQRNSGQSGTGVMQFGTSLTNDMCAGIAGQSLTLQFIVSTGANFSPTSGNLTVTVSYGTGNSNKSNISSTFTGNTSILSQTIALGTSAAATLYSYTTSACSSSATQVSVVFSWTPTGTASTNDWVQIQACQLEIGSTANLFQRRGQQQVFGDCNYWYDKNIDQTVAPAQGAGNIYSTTFQTPATSGQIAYQGMRYSRGMYDSGGTLTLYNPVNSNAQVYDYKNSADCSSTTVPAKDSTGFQFHFVPDTATATSAYYNIIYSHDNDIT